MKIAKHLMYFDNVATCVTNTSMYIDDIYCVFLYSSIFQASPVAV